MPRKRPSPASLAKKAAHEFNKKTKELLPDWERFYYWHLQDIEEFELTVGDSGDNQALGYVLDDHYVPRSTVWAWERREWINLITAYQDGTRVYEITDEGREAAKNTTRIRSVRI